MVKVICQSFMALVVWAAKQYHADDEHFKKTHLKTAVLNAKLLSDYVRENESYIKAKEGYKTEGSGRADLLKAKKRFGTARKELHDFLAKND
jgi:hypothetical protein